VLLFTRGATTDRIWFYDMAHDGFSLDDKRQRAAENDIPDILECWRHRHDARFEAGRASRLDSLRSEAAPLKAERLRLHGEINRLTFESAIAPEDQDLTGFQNLSGLRSTPRKPAWPRSKPASRRCNRRSTA